MRTWTVALLLLAVTLAGCSDGEAPAPEPDESFQPVVTDSDLGAISGVVVDEAILPVVGATVTVQGLGLTTETNEGGQFVVEELEPGTSSWTSRPLRSCPSRAASPSPRARSRRCASRSNRTRRRSHTTRPWRSTASCNST